MKFKTNLKIKSGIIAPVPLVDIVLQIVIFFVVATQFIGRPGLVLQLPSAGTTVLYREGTAKVTLTDQKLFFQGEKITKEQLGEKLGEGSVSMLVIEADNDIAHLEVIEIIDLAKRMGVSQIAIAAEGKE